MINNHLVIVVLIVVSIEPDLSQLAATSDIQ